MLDVFPVTSTRGERSSTFSSNRRRSADGLRVDDGGMFSSHPPFSSDQRQSTDGLGGGHGGVFSTATVGALSFSVRLSWLTFAALTGLPGQGYLQQLQGF
ncbi:hypothetical protein HN51_007029 [Arachis hypogaea]